MSLQKLYMKFYSDRSQLSIRSGVSFMLGIKKYCKSRCGYGSVNVVALLLLPGLFSLFYFSRDSHDHTTGSTSVKEWTGRTLLSTDEKIVDIHDTEFIIGYALGWISAVIYFFALPPQIIKNVSSCSLYSIPSETSYFVPCRVILFSEEENYRARGPHVHGDIWEEGGTMVTTFNVHRHCNFLLTQQF